MTHEVGVTVRSREAIELFRIQESENFACSRILAYHNPDSSWRKAVGFNVTYPVLAEVLVVEVHLFPTPMAHQREHPRRLQIHTS